MQNKPLNTFDMMDAMRAIAAIIVVFGHERDLLFLSDSASLPRAWKAFHLATSFGTQAVMVFFVLSGYWITKTVAQRVDNNDFHWLEYGIDRLSRLWIVLIPALILGGMLDLFGRYHLSSALYLGTQGTKTLLYDVGSTLSISSFIGNIVFVQHILVPNFGSNGPLWSLSNEFWYYVWFPPLYQLLNRKRASVFACLTAAITMILFSGMLLGFVCWLFGSIVFLLSRNVSHGSAKPRIALVRVVTFCFVGILILTRLPIEDWISALVTGGSFAILLYTLLRADLRYPGWMAPVSRYGAQSSYSLYVVHFPFLVLIAALFFTPMHRLTPSASLLLVFAGLSVLTIGYGLIFSSITEAYTKRVRQWLLSKVASHRDMKPSRSIATGESAP